MTPNVFHQSSRLESAWTEAHVWVAVACDEIRDQFAGDGPEAQSHHRVTRGDGEVAESRRAADIGQSVGRTWAESCPGCDVPEVFVMELREIAGSGFNDALNASWVDARVGGSHFHGARKS